MPGRPVNEKAVEISYHNWALEHDIISRSALRELSQQCVYYKTLRLKSDDNPISWIWRTDQLMTEYV